MCRWEQFVRACTLPAPNSAFCGKPRTGRKTTMPERDDWEWALRQGLRNAPSPPVSADFDARVLDALARPQTWWKAIWEQARPLLTGAACSLVVMLLIVYWSQ